MSGELHSHQIEELLLNAHLECEGGIDLIEEYFTVYSSLDKITVFAKGLLHQESDIQIQKSVIRNLAECIVVKTQRDQHSIFGIARRFLERKGLSLRRKGEIRRAERLVQDFRKKWDA